MKDIYIFENEVLELFRRISRIPRESGNEKAVSDRILAWAREQGLQASQDEIGDLIICKPAAPGYEEHAPVMLQAHLDMVCEKNAGSTHDFEKDPIELAYDGEWIRSADGTTLGADNGIGVAAAMVLLADKNLPAPALEVVFTVQEETTFAGAETVDISGLSASRMINLDHANERELIVGSCGGTGVEFTLPIGREEEIPAGYQAARVRISGLAGGHSGEDIHRGRGNAISLLLQLLESLDLPVVSISGGTNRLAIPREAEAVVLTPDGEGLRQRAADAKAALTRVYAAACPDLEIMIEEAEPAQPLQKASFEKIAAAVRLYPNGIAQMNGSFDGLVESSDNIGIIQAEGDQLKLVSEVRGAYQITVDQIVQTIRTLAGLLGGTVSCFCGYLPWEFRAESRLRNLAAETYQQMFGEPMKQLAVHAGLECGFFAEKRPGMDMISIGPDCEYFHSPQERVRAESVEHFYAFLRELLGKL